MKKNCLLLLACLSFALVSACGDDDKDKKVETCDVKTYVPTCIDSHTLRSCVDAGEVLVQSCLCQTRADIAKDVWHGDEAVMEKAFPYPAWCATECTAEQVGQENYNRCLDHDQGFIIKNVCKKDAVDQKYYYETSLETCDGACHYDEDTFAVCAHTGDSCVNLGSIGCNGKKAYYCVNNGKDHSSTEKTIAAISCINDEVCIDDAVGVFCRQPCTEEGKEADYCLDTDMMAPLTCLPHAKGETGTPISSKLYPISIKARAYGVQSSTSTCVNGELVPIIDVAKTIPELACNSAADAGKGHCVANTPIVCNYKEGQSDNKLYKKHICRLNEGEICREGDVPYCSWPCTTEGETINKLFGVYENVDADGTFTCTKTDRGLFYTLTNYVID